METIYPEKWQTPPIENLPREWDEVMCSCGKTAERVEPTKEEIESPRFNCGKSYPCCVRAFECTTCKTRLVGRAAAPDLD
jgi:hypothetical protein